MKFPWPEHGLLRDGFNSGRRSGRCRAIASDEEQGPKSYQKTQELHVWSRSASRRACRCGQRFPDGRPGSHDPLCPSLQLQPCPIRHPRKERQ